MAKKDPGSTVQPGKGTTRPDGKVLPPIKGY